MYKKIDFHTHYLSEGYKKFLTDKFDDNADEVKTPDYQSIDKTLEVMEENNIEYSVISLSSPHVNIGDNNLANELAHDINEFGQESSTKYPDKIGYFATLPLSTTEDSIKELDWIDSHAGNIGLTMPTNSNGLYLGDPKMEDLMKKLNEKERLIMIHPNAPQVIPAANDIPSPIMEFFFDTTRTVVNMLEHGIFKNYTNIKWIIPHAGSVLPLLVNRVQNLSQTLNPKLEDWQVDLKSVMATQYFDLAGIVLPQQVETLTQWTDPSHLLYASDAPYTPSKAIQKFAGQLEDTGLLSEPMKKMIFHENGTKLLREFK